MSIKRTLAGLFLAALCSSVFAQATTSTAITYPPEIDKRRNFHPLDESLFGDQVHLQDGSVVFVQTDVSVPTNSGMPLELGRRSPVGRGDNRGTVPDIFGDWDPDIPVMKGIYDARDGWNAGASDGKRCSTGTFVPKAEPPLTSNMGTSSVPQSYYWHGVQITLPHFGTEQLLKKNANQVLPTDGRTYVGTTKSQWRVSCLASLQNGTGEGFAVTVPNGTTYTFDWIVTRTPPPLIAISYPSPNTAANLVEVYLYATKVTDRYGNTVTYQFDPASPSHLTSIKSSDGGQITVGYSNGLVISAAVGNRNWTYGYTAGTGVVNYLTSLTLPDASQWTFSGSQDSGTNMWGIMIGFWNQSCRSATVGAGSESSGYGTTPLGTRTLTMTHPSGAQGTFTFYITHHGTTNTPGACMINGSNVSTIGLPSAFAVWSIVEKSVQGPGLPQRDWRYNYNTSWSFAACPASGCASTSTTTVLRNDGVTRTYAYGNNYSLNLGQLVSETVWGNGSQQTTNYVYQTSATGQPFPDNTGDVPLGIYNTTGPYPPYYQAYGNPLDYQMRPVSTVATTVDGITLTKAVTAYDRFARILSTTDSNGSYSRNRGSAYFDDLQHWVLGQVASQTVNSTIVSRTDFNSLARPWKTYAFEKLHETLAYNADGTLASSADGNNATISYSSWKRGLPQAVRYPATPESPSGALETATVDDNGWISSRQDAAGSSTCYQYDLMGRLTKISYPMLGSPATCDTNGTTLNPTTILRSVSPANEYGIAPGHWRQTRQTGQAVENIYLDAYWRPIVKEHYDATNAAATRSVEVTRFDLSEKTAFLSYPMNSLSDWSTTNTGVRNSYDSMGRLTREERDTELGIEAVTNVYSALSVASTNPRGYTTTTRYQMFDTLDYDRPMSIALPEGVNVTFARDAVGSTTSITRSGTYAGATVSATRNYVYDSSEQLCKVIEPEIGATLMDWDAAGNRLWVTGGTSLTSNACDRASVAAAQKVNFGYDALQRLVSTSYGDGSPGITRTYKPDGLAASISSDGSVWTYEYNSLRKMASETLTFGGSAYTLNWSFDMNGNISQLTYPAPTSKVVNFAPNALGQATKAQSYASSISYFPNGAVQGLVYGNGISRTVTQNVRHLPASIVEPGILNDVLTYDPVGNISKIDDRLAGLTTRTMSYDGLDRMTAANGAWGTGTYSYDPLDNVRSSTVGGRSLSFSYDAATNRLSGTTGSMSLAVGYDANGNVTSRGVQGYVFDMANRLRNVSGKATYQYDGQGRRTYTSNSDGSTLLQMYDAAGRTVFAVNGGRTTNYVFLDHMMIAEDDSASGITYLHTDSLGTPVARSTSSGAILSTTRFEPFGAIYSGTTPSAPDNVAFTGHVYDAGTGLIYMQQRYYDPITGRFLSVDPVATDAATGKAFGRYHYAENNPYRFTDPDGRDIQILVGGPYSGHNYGHVAIRVVGQGYDRIYDYGRYGKTYGVTGAEGEGILRVWSNFQKYIAGENATGRETTGFNYKTSEAQDKATMAYYDKQVADKKPTVDDVRAGFMKQYNINTYNGANNNCTTESLGGFAAGNKDAAKKLDDNKFDLGGGLTATEKMLYRMNKDGDGVRMPADLKKAIEATHEYDRTETYRNGR
jgi:RHS repeat-associated protein